MYSCEMHNVVKKRENASNDGTLSTQKVSKQYFEEPTPIPLNKNPKNIQEIKENENVIKVDRTIPDIILKYIELLWKPQIY